MKAEQKKTLTIHHLQGLASNAAGHEGCDAILRESGVMFRIRRIVGGRVVQWSQLITWSDLTMSRGGTHPYSMLKDAEKEIERLSAEIEREIAYNAPPKTSAG